MRVGAFVTVAIVGAGVLAMVPWCAARRHVSAPTAHPPIAVTTSPDYRGGDGSAHRANAPQFPAGLEDTRRVEWARDASATDRELQDAIATWARNARLTDDQTRQLMIAIVDAQMNMRAAQYMYIMQGIEPHPAMTDDEAKAEVIQVINGRDARAELLERVREIAGTEASESFDFEFGNFAPIIVGAKLVAISDASPR